MVLKKHQVEIGMPEMYDVLYVTITDHNGLINSVMRVSAETLSKLYDKPTDGVPTHFCLHNEKIRLYPRPEKEYDVHIEYLPPVRSL